MVFKIDPKVDFAFKWLFGRQNNLPLLRKLLNAVLIPAPGSEIVDLELLNPFSEQESADDKLSIVDVKARDQNGRQFEIEMQLLIEKAFSKRILYYWADLHRQQLKAGEAYKQLRPTISIAFTDFILFPEVSDYKLAFELVNRQHSLIFDSDILVILIELPKFHLAAEQVKSPFDAWLYFLGNAVHLESNALPASLDKPEIRKALEELDMLSQDDLERERYKARLKVQRDEKSRLESALSEGLERGLERGREEGREEGTLSVVLRLARKKFRVLDNATEAKLRELKRGDLDELVEVILDLRTLGDLQAWLEK